MRDIEAQALGAKPDEASIERLARQAADAIEPEEDEQVPAVFRKELIETLTARALRHALATTERVQ
jgi:carbon-monoxide dehydrogenase medium subunit